MMYVLAKGMSHCSERKCVMFWLCAEFYGKMVKVNENKRMEMVLDMLILIILSFHQICSYNIKMTQIVQ